MTRPKRWTTDEHNDGILEVRLSSWKYFSDFINQELLNHVQYIFRGQAAAKWPLQSTLDRALSGRPPGKAAALRKLHLRRFQLAVRGRRGQNPSKLESDNDWWA